MTWSLALSLAGPLATVIASVTAGIITYRFGSIQAKIAATQAETAAAAKEIARSQRDIAYDKLKHDLFDKRYEIYTTARELIEYISGEKFEGVHDPKLLLMRRKLDEARFFFPPAEAAIFSAIESAAAQYLVGAVERQHAGDDDEARLAAANKMTNVLKMLVTTYGKFPELMQSELGFSQLTLSKGEAAR